MKIKKSYIIGVAVVALLAVFIVMGVTRPDPHAGHDHGDTQSTVDPHSTQPDAPADKDLTPDKSYILKDNKDGTYGVTVKGRSGKQFYSEPKLPVKPTFTEANQDVLEIAYRDSDNTAAHWATYCDIQNQRVSKTYRFVLAVMDHHVAYVEHRSGEFHVFVSDVFDEKAYFKGYKLEGAALTDSGSPKVSYKLNGTTLTVTYSTEKGDKSIDIKMFEK